METIQLTIEDSLLAEVRQATNALQITPSDFFKVALERAVQQRELIAKERQHAEAYANHPQQPEAIEEWQSEHDSGECLLKAAEIRRSLEGRQHSDSTVLEADDRTMPK